MIRRASVQHQCITPFSCKIIWPLQLQNLSGYPIPVFHEGYLGSHRTGTGQLHVSITPGSQLAIISQIFITHIMATDKDNFSVDYNVLAMIAKVNLNMGKPSFDREKIAELNASRTHSSS